MVLVWCSLKIIHCSQVWFLTSLSYKHAYLRSLSREQALRLFSCVKKYRDVLDSVPTQVIESHHFDSHHMQQPAWSCHQDMQVLRYSCVLLFNPRNLSINAVTFQDNVSGTDFTWPRLVDSAVQD